MDDLDLAEGADSMPQGNASASLAAYGTGINLLPIPETQGSLSCTELLILSTRSSGGAVGNGGATLTRYTINSTSTADYPAAPLTAAWAASLANFSAYSGVSGLAYARLPPASTSSPSAPSINLVVQFGPPLDAINCPCNTTKCVACISNSTIGGYYLS